MKTVFKKTGFYSMIIPTIWKKRVSNDIKEKIMRIIGFYYFYNLVFRTNIFIKNSSMKIFRVAFLVSLFVLNSCELFDDISADNFGIAVKTYSANIHNVRDVFFINKSVGYLVGENGMIKKTSDGGQTWDSQESETTLNLTNVFFVNENIGFATGAYSQCPEEDCYKSGMFLKTTNGGKNWEKELKPDIAFFYDLYFFDENNGIGILKIMGSEIYAATTENGGKTWNYLNLKMSKISFYSTRSIKKIFVNSNVCYILGEDMIYKSADLFKNRETIHVPIEIKNACFINSEVGYISDNFSIYKTNNGGENWKKLPGPDVRI
jgi:photosystem II stability/assembly factor-like uncharacterized protein